MTDKDYRTVYTSLSSIYSWMISQTRVSIIHIQTNKNINLLEKDPLCPCVGESFLLQIFDPSLPQFNHKEMLNYEQIYGPHAGGVQYKICMKRWIYKIKMKISPTLFGFFIRSEPRDVKKLRFNFLF